MDEKQEKSSENLTIHQEKHEKYPENLLLKSSSVKKIEGQPASPQDQAQISNLKSHHISNRMPQIQSKVPRESFNNISS